MSEYWKSTPKYWCKHCKTFVVDTKFSRTQHDATGKHQGALNRFLRDLHRANEREIVTKAAAKKEVQRLNAVTSGKPVAGASSGAGAGTTTTTKWASSATRPVSEAEQKAQMKQLESLGVALPEEFRKEVALPGEWTATEITTDTTTTTTTSGGGRSGERSRQKEAIKEEIIRKRKADEEARRWEEMDEDERVMKKFKIETKTYPGDAYGEGEDEELDALLGVGKGKIPVAVKKEDGKVIKREEEIAHTTLIGGYGGAAIVKQEEGVEKKLGDGIAFKKRKVGNLRKK
ncbi:hypothetical protein BGX38DRAFT_1088859 [Terfezia claveryi]|nr:hypothetical protein BGX38DRAFT_1088859 [Terfezia claveryi]